jgi:hypothetical protein
MPTTSAAPETGTAASAAGSSTGEAATVERIVPWGIRAIISEALTEIGKAEHFTAQEIDTLWKAVAPKLWEAVASGL